MANHTNRVWRKNITNSRDLTLDNLDVDTITADTINVDTLTTVTFLLDDIEGNLTLSRGSFTAGLTRELTIEGARSASSTTYARIKFDNLDDNSDNINYTGAIISSHNDIGDDTGDLRFEVFNGISLNRRLKLDDSHMQLDFDDDNRIGQIVVNQVGLGDSAVQFSTPGQEWVMGIDNSQSQRFKINEGDELTATTPHICLEVGGNTGIGIPNPAFQLELGIDSAAKPTGGQWTTTSDRKFKENIKNRSLIKSQDLIKKLRLREYTFNDYFVNKHKITNNSVRLGLIAQEVDEVVKSSNNDIADDRIVKEINKDDEEPYLTLNLDQINFNLLGAVQQILKRVDRLERKNTELTSQLKLHIEETNI